MATTNTPEVLVATSREEAVRAFGDGQGVTLVGGGTIVMPEVTHGNLRPRRALLLTRAGLTAVSETAGRYTIGAMAPVASLESLPEPLGGAARASARNAARISSGAIVHAFCMISASPADREFR